MKDGGGASPAVSKTFAGALFFFFRFLPAAESDDSDATPRPSGPLYTAQEPLCFSFCELQRFFSIGAHTTTQHALLLLHK